MYRQQQSAGRYLEVSALQLGKTKGIHNIHTSFVCPGRHWKLRLSWSMYTYLLTWRRLLPVIKAGWLLYAFPVQRSNYLAVSKCPSPWEKTKGIHNIHTYIIPSRRTHTYVGITAAPREMAFVVAEVHLLTWEMVAACDGCRVRYSSIHSRSKDAYAGNMIHCIH